MMAVGRIDAITQSQHQEGLQSLLDSRPVNRPGLSVQRPPPDSDWMATLHATPNLGSWQALRKCNFLAGALTVSKCHLFETTRSSITRWPSVPRWRPAIAIVVRRRSAIVDRWWRRRPIFRRRWRPPGRLNDAAGQREGREQRQGQAHKPHTMLLETSENKDRLIPVTFPILNYWTERINLSIGCVCGFLRSYRHLLQFGTQQ